MAGGPPIQLLARWGEPTGRTRASGHTLRQRATVPHRSRPKLGSGPESWMTSVSMRWMKVPTLIQQGKSGTSCSAHVAVSGTEVPRIDRIDVGRPRPADRCRSHRHRRPIRPLLGAVRVPIDGIGSPACLMAPDVAPADGIGPVGRSMWPGDARADRRRTSRAGSPSSAASGQAAMPWHARDPRRRAARRRGQWLRV